MTPPYTSFDGESDLATTYRRENLLLMTDSYKVGHWPQYPPQTEHVYSYFESREGSAYPATVFFGLQYVIMKHLLGGFTPSDIAEADKLYAQHFGSSSMFNNAGWTRMFEKHRGKLPVRIKAVPEGTVVPISNVLMTIENTDPEFPWLSNFLETLLVQVWYPTTVATISWYVRQKISKYLAQTGDESGLDFKLHDFGFRGASSAETAALGGAAHLTSFLGTDTVAALTLLRDYYGAATAAGFSVPASEHSTMTSWGREHEADAYRNMIERYGSYPYYSVVSDSYDIYNAVANIWGGVLRDDVLAADGSLVIRPDSGNPPEVMIKLCDLIAEKFGAIKNAKGYKVLHPKVRLIWGDGLDPRMIESILMRMRTAGYSAENTVFGMGGGLLQKVNRDTQRFAFKASQVTIDGKQFDVSKDPVGDHSKASKAGRLALISEGHGMYSTVRTTDLGAPDDVLETVFENGELKRVQTLDDIRTKNGMVALPLPA